MTGEIPTVGDYMTPGAYVTAPDEYASRARAVMRTHGIRHLAVMKGGKVVGIVSDRDLAAARSLRPGGALVDETMSVNLYTVSPDALLNVVARAMAKRKCGSAVVVDRDSVVGVFTTTDALVALAEALEGKVARRSAERIGTMPAHRSRKAKLTGREIRGRSASRGV